MSCNDDVMSNLRWIGRQRRFSRAKIPHSQSPENEPWRTLRAADEENVDYRWLSRLEGSQSHKHRAFGRTRQTIGSEAFRLAVSARSK